MSANTLTTQDYFPDLPLSLIFNIDESYSMTGKKVTFEIVNDSDTVVFRYTSGVDTQLEIDGQVVTLNIDPATESEDDLGYTLAEAMNPSRHTTNRNYNLDFQAIGSDTVDIRIQGDFDVQRAHGPLS